MIVISNIYHMLAYAFRSLNVGDTSHMGNEDFENLNELFAEIICRGMRKQVKRGLPHGYVRQSENLANLRGKIDIQCSVSEMTMTKHQLVCEFDDFSVNTPSNRLIKCAISQLLQKNDVSLTRKQCLKFLRSSLNNVDDVRYIRIPHQRKGSAEYTMLVNICQFMLDGMLMHTGGGYVMREWLSDEAMSSLYERFLLEYYKRHYPLLKARKSRISWDMTSFSPHMPKMESDVYLTFGGKTLIIDAKFYSRTMTEYFGKKTYHSQNLYQIYTYVKNADKMKDGSVEGMLLYARTDEDVTPDNEGIIIGGNIFSVKTLDLSQNFIAIRSQLDKVAARLA